MSVVSFIDLVFVRLKLKCSRSCYRYFIVANNGKMFMKKGGIKSTKVQFATKALKKHRSSRTLARLFANIRCTLPFFFRQSVCKKSSKSITFLNPCFRKPSYKELSLVKSGKSNCIAKAT